MYGPRGDWKSAAANRLRRIETIALALIIPLVLLAGCEDSTLTLTPSPTPTPTLVEVAEELRQALQDVERERDIYILLRVGSAKLRILCDIAYGNYEPRLSLEYLTDGLDDIVPIRIGTRGLCGALERDVW